MISEKKEKKGKPQEESYHVLCFNFTKQILTRCVRLSNLLSFRIWNSNLAVWPAEARTNETCWTAETGGASPPDFGFHLQWAPHCRYDTHVFAVQATKMSRWGGQAMGMELSFTRQKGTSPHLTSVFFVFRELLNFIYSLFISSCKWYLHSSCSVTSFPHQ